MNQRKRQKYNTGNAGLPEVIRQQRAKMFQQGQLWCSDCEQFKPVKEFYKDKVSDHKNYGYRFHCKECNAIRSRKRKDRLSQLAKKRNSRLSQQWAKLAGGKCQRCGYDEFYSGLSFHHVYPVEKEYPPSYVIINSTTEAGYRRCWQELDKCCLLCLNCHTGYEAGLWRAEFVKRDGLGWTIGEILPLSDTRYRKEPAAYCQAELEFNWEIRQHVKQLKLIEQKANYIIFKN